MTPSHRREAYSLAYEAASRHALRPTKLSFVGARLHPSLKPFDGARWAVIAEIDAAKGATSTIHAAAFFTDLHSVIRWIEYQEAKGNVPLVSLLTRSTVDQAHDQAHAAPPEASTKALAAMHSILAGEPNPLERRPQEPAKAPESVQIPSVDAALAVALASIREAVRAEVPKTPALDEAAVERITAPLIARAVKEALDAAPARRIEIKIPDIEAFDATEEHERFGDILQELATGNPIMLAGPAGSGKTTAAEHAAQRLGLAVYIIQPPSDPFDIYGYRDANGTYQSSPAWRALTDERPACIILDEIDRSEPRALCAMHSILARNGYASFPHAQIPVPPTLRIIATANTWGLGASAAYVGANKLDDATLSRFASRLDIGYDEKLEERLALANGGTPALYGRCKAVRAKLQERGIRVAWTPRDTVALARRIAAGVPEPEAWNRSVLVTLTAAQRKEMPV